MNDMKLSAVRIEAYRRNLEEGPPFAFVAVLPDASVDGIQGALGIAVANEPGFYMVPLGWARFASMDAAQAGAEEANAELGVSDDTAFRIVASTMGGKRFYAAA